MHMAFRSLALDVIMDYTFGQSFDTLGTRRFRHPTVVSLQDGIPAFNLFHHFKIVPAVMMSLPKWLLLRLNPDARGVVDILTLFERQSDEVLSDPEYLDRAPHEVIYQHLTGINAQKATKSYLVGEAHTLLRAGSDTTAGTITAGVFHVLDNKDILVRLRAELDQVRPSDNTLIVFEVLENLPYLVSTQNIASPFVVPLISIGRLRSSKKRCE
jgi:cytochrome P450